MRLIGLQKDVGKLERSTRVYCRQYGTWSGHLWQGRFYSCAFEGLRMASVMRYVELNPVRAGLVRAEQDYAWSSAVTHLGGINALGLLDLETWRRDWTKAD